MAGLMTGLIGMSPTQIGKAAFSFRIVYRTADGQLVYEEYVPISHPLSVSQNLRLINGNSLSLAEGQDSESFIPFAHFEGGNPAEEDERWMRWANLYIGKFWMISKLRTLTLIVLTAPNPQPCATELMYNSDGVARLPEFTGTNDIFWTRKVLRAYFHVLWGEHH